MRNKKFYIVGFLSTALLVLVGILISSPAEVPLQGSLRQSDGTTASDGYYDLRVVGYDQATGQQTISQDFTDVLIKNGNYNLPLTLPRFSQTGNSYLQICRSSFPSLTEDGIQDSTPDGGCVEPIQNQKTFTYAECPQTITIDRSQGIAGLLGAPNASLFGECVYSASASETGSQIPLAPSDASAPSVVAIQGEKGDKGDSGLDGIVGPTGPQGEPGRAGEDGTNGQNGTDGSNGAPGAQGPAGDPASDDQTLAYVGGTQVLSIAGGNSVNLSNLLDNTDQLADLSCAAGEVAQWNGTAWQCAAVGADTDDQTLSLVGSDLSIASGNTVSLASFLDNTDLLASLSCAANEIARWSGVAWVCSDDIDTVLDEATVDAYTANNGYLTSEVDAVVGNEVLNATSNKGLVRTGAGTAGDPFTLGLINCANNEILKYSTGSSTWGCAADADTDTDTTYSAGTGITIVGTVISSTLGTSIDDTEVSDAITIGASGSVADGALSGNVSLLGGSIDSTEITNGTIAFADLATNGCNSGEIIEFNGSAWICGVDGDTTYSAGTGISFVGNVISATLGTSVSSSEIDADTIVAADIASGAVETTEILNGTILFADIAQNGCTNDQVIKYNGSAWICGADIDTVLDEATVDAYVSNNGYLTSEVDGSTTNELQNIFATIDTDNGTDPVADSTSDTLALASGSGVTITGNGATDTITIAAILGTSIDSSEITDATITFADLGTNSCNSGEIIKFNGSAWYCGTDIDTDTSLSEAQVEAFIFDADNTGTISSGTLALDSLSYTGTLDDANVNDALTISAAGSVADGALSANVSLLGSSIDSTEITNGTILFADINSNSCSSGEIMEYNGSAWICGVDGDTTYSAGTGISFAGTVISSTLGTAVDSSEITNATILFADLASNSCNGGEIIKFNGSAWYCGTDIDTDTTLSEAQVEAYIFDADNTGTISSGTFALDSLSYTGTLDDANVNDALTISAAGSVADGALSANVSLLGSSIDSAEVANGTILFADLNANGCNSGEIMEYNGSAWICGTDGDTTYSAGTGISFAGTVISSTLGTAIDTSEITNATILFADLASNSCNADEIIKFNGSAWYCGADVDTDTSLNEAQVEAFIFDADNTGTISSGTLALDSLSYTGTLDDANVNDALTVSAAGSVADGALSANVSLLGSSIDSTEITNGTILFADIASNSCNSGEIMEYNGSAWSCGTDGDTTYSAGTGISFAGTVISSTLGTAIDSTEITNATIAFADIASNSCNTDEIFKFNGSAWYCGTDTDTSLTEGQVEAFIFDADNTGTISSGTLALDSLSYTGTLDDANVNDALTISASGSVADGALSANVSLLGSSIDSTEITNGTILFADINANSCNSGEVMEYNGSAWSCGVDSDTTYSAGTGISFAGTVISSTLGTAIDSTEITDATIAFADLASNSCGSGATIEYNGSAWICGTDDVNDADASATNELQNLFSTIDAPAGTDPVADAQTDTLTLAAGSNISITGDSSTDTITIAASFSETDGVVGNEIVNATTNQGLVRTGAGTGGDPYTLGLMSCADNEILKYDLDTTTWGCAGDGDTTYSAGTGISLVGTVISATLGTSIDDSEVADNITIGATGSVNDGALSANVSLLGSSIDSTEITNGTIAFTDIASNSCNSGEIMEYNGSAWICGVDGDTTYSAGTGISFAGTVISSTLGTSVDSTEIDANTIAAGDIATGAVETTEILDGTILFADLGQNSCGNDDIIKWNGSAWACAVDVDTTLSEAQVDTYVSNNGYLTSEVDGSTSNELQNLFATIDADNGTDPVADSQTDTLTLASGSGVTVTGDGTTDTITIAAVLGTSIDSSEIANNTIVFADIASNSCGTNDIMKFNGSAWYCGTDVDTDTTLNEAQVEAFIFDADNTGTLSSGTLALDSLSYTGTLDDANVNDALTISSSGSVADGALSANVSLLGSSIDSTEITNGTILFADLASNSCNSGEVMEYNGSAWICGTDTDTTYSAGTGISFAGTVISSTLGTAIDSSEITDGTIGNGDLANSAVTITSGSGLINGGSVALGASVTLDIGAGNGITVNANDVAVRALSSADALSSTTSSGSGLEVLATGVGLLQGCADSELLKWNEASDVWACGTDSTGSIAADSLNFTDFSDSLSLDAATTISLGANNFTTNLNSTGDFLLQFGGNTVLQILDTGAVTIGNVLADQTIGIDNGTGIINIATDSDANTTSIGTGTSTDTVTIGDANANVSLTDAQWSISGAGAASFATFAGSGLTDCDGNGDVLKWDSTTSQFVCGTNRATFHNVLNGNYTNNTNGFTDVDADADATDDLGFAIGANETWVFETWMQYNSPAAADSQWQVTGPVGATCDIQYIDLENANTLANLGCAATSGNQATVAADDTTLMVGVVANGANAGTVMNQFRQNTASGTSTIYAGSYITAYRVSGADYAENYFTTEYDVAPGMIVELTGEGVSQVKKSSSPYSDRQIGIVSTEPGQLIGAADGVGRPVPVAMSGRVPVKISTENGLPKAGDMITASATKPGYAMRATKSGTIVGQLMVNAIDNGDGTATGYVYVRHGYWQAPLAIDLGTIMETQTTINDADVAKTADELQLADAFSGQFDSLSQEVIDEILNGFTLQQGAIDSLEQRVAQLESGGVVSDASMIELITQADGKLTVLGDTIFTGSVWFQGPTSFASNAAGELTVSAGTTEGQATFDPAYARAPYVTVTPQDFINGSWRVKNVSETGFTVELSAPQPATTRFTWQAVQTDTGE